MEKNDFILYFFLNLKKKCELYIYLKKDLLFYLNNKIPLFS